MAKLQEVAKYVRSKNAGPFWATIEIFCSSEADYQQVIQSKNISKASIAALYSVAAADVQMYYIPDIYVVKISFPRPYPSGYRYERDMHYGQQYRLLAQVEL